MIENYRPLARKPIYGAAFPTGTKNEIEGYQTLAALHKNAASPQVAMRMLLTPAGLLLHGREAGVAAAMAELKYY
ncbi:MAG: hypothetical protein WAN46_09050 [Gammaproteobacteria bacterium]